MRLVAATLLTTVVAAAPAAGVARAAPTPTQRLKADVQRAVAPGKGRVSVVVRDVAGRRTSVDLRGSTDRPLGSTAKLFTAAAVLEGFQPDLTTQVLAAAAPDAAGVLTGDLVLRGGGDPSFGSAAFAASRDELPSTDAAALADQLVAAGLREVRGSVVGDESVFDLLRGGPSTSGAFDPELEGVLGGLTADRGRDPATGQPSDRPAAFAAAAFDDLLEARGVVITGFPRAGVAPVGAVPVAQLTRPAASLVRPMLKRSDDLYAEALAKGLGARAGTVPATTAAGAAAIQRVAGRLGAGVRIADGSGLSAATRGSARDLVALLVAARRRPWGSTLTAALPVAGRDGTLARRLTARPARGNCRAKTGNLGTTVAALAGTCRTRTGRVLAFAVQVQGLPLAAGQGLTDRVALAVARARL